MKKIILMGLLVFGFIFYCADSLHGLSDYPAGTVKEEYYQAILPGMRYVGNFYVDMYKNAGWEILSQEVTTSGFLHIKAQKL
jgi:hypothetical protein